MTGKLIVNSKLASAPDYLNPLYGWDELCRLHKDAAAEDAAVLEAGGVIVFWANGWLHLKSSTRQLTYRGSSVEGCDAEDSFVRHLAQELIN